MNSVVLIGRLVRDPETRYTADQMAIASFTVAVDRPVAADKEKQTDFPRVTVFGKQAENCGQYLTKGRQVAVQGRIRTGSYKNKEGATVYTTEVIGERVQFLGSKPEGSGGGSPGAAPANPASPAPPEGGYQQLEEDDDIPF
ncbi:MAG: single-stranded DNA-binding protein [Clostridiales Family XIII bacterium]|jgi:single-strand DNA-binding protein|nr:single-stranded DNA-binding protein [Clostridiales Family XIII bacterium]